MFEDMEGPNVNSSDSEDAEDVQDQDVQDQDEQAQDESDEATPAEFQFQPNTVTMLNLCETNEATELVIYNLRNNLQNCDQYDIGGTYTKGNPDVWFFYTTTMGVKIRLLNIFACQRNKGTIKITYSDLPSTTQITTLSPLKQSSMPYCSILNLSINKFRTRILKSSENNKCHYITTYGFNPDDVDHIKNKNIHIPIKIEIEPKYPVNSEIVKKIKTNHCLTGIFKRNENTDFILESSTGKKYNVHKIVLSAQSNVIKDMVRDSETNTAVLDVNDDEMEDLLEFLYTGKAKSVLDEHCIKLIDIAYRFKIEKLLKLLQLVIVNKINVTNAVEIAVLTERYKLESIQKDVFEFIKNNPEVIDTEGWTNLNDVALTKKLFRKIYVEN